MDLFLYKKKPRIEKKKVLTKLCDKSVNISLSMIVFEDSDSDDLEGDEYTCGTCKETFTNFKNYKCHKQERCNKLRSYLVRFCYDKL